MVAVEDRAELLLRERLRLALGDRELAGAVGLQPRELGLGELRVAGDVGDERDHLRAELREHVAADVGAVLADVDVERAAHPRGVLGDLRGGARLGPLREQVAGEVGEPDLVGLLVDVAGADGRGAP